MSEEVVAIVDEHDRVIGAALRSHMRRRRLRHRAVYILVFDSAGRLLVHQRVAHKDVYPSYWDVAFGGVVAADEDYDIAAARELQEEAGLMDRLRRVFSIYFEDEGSRVHGAAYLCRTVAEPVLQDSEVASAAWLDLDALRARIDDQPFCPDGLLVLNRVLAIPPDELHAMLEA